ncbi:MAG: helix-hairpin-helix domain-containing protein [Bacteroidales bacterium]|nr:helix-hairpin-helix domain-containing protein [Bacteroidales bacterium]
MAKRSMNTHRSKLPYYNLFHYSFAFFVLNFENFAVKKYFFCIFFFVFYSISSINTRCQEENLSESIASFAEELAENETDPEAVAAYIEKLHELTENPVALNSADETELSRLFFLTGFQIRALAEYIHSTGRIFSVYEIVNVPGFDRELASLIIPFISLESKATQPSDFKRPLNTVLTNFSAKQGQTEEYSGTDHKILLKYKLNGNGFSAGITAEKDSGERYFSGDPAQPDFLSGHLAWFGTGMIRKIIIGDYSAKFGLGTAINTGLRTGLSLTSPGCLSGGIDEIRPYTSSDENNFFRGAAMMLRYKKLDLSFFYSVNKIDATVISYDGIHPDYIESFYTSGVHNSYNSLLKKDSVSELNYGATLGLNLNNLLLGLLWTKTEFSLPVKTTVKDPVDLYDFEGSSNQTVSGYYRASLGRTMLFGEFSSDRRGHMAIVQGISMRPAERFSLTLLFRNYEPGFMAFHGRGPFSTTSGDNIKGLYANLTFEAAKYFFMSAGCDLRNYPWLRYRCSVPSSSFGSEIRLKYIPAGSWSAEAVFGFRKSITDVSGSLGIEKQKESEARLLKGSLKYSPGGNFTLTSRIGYNIIGSPQSRGMFIMQDINWRFTKIPVSVWMRYCIFSTDDWESRLYTYENDLLHSYSIPALSDEGKRTYAMVAWKFSGHGDMRVKYAMTEFNEKSGRSSSGEIKVQVRFWF